MKQIKKYLYMVLLSISIALGFQITAQAQIASGTEGTCSWVIDDDGVLTISAGTLGNRNTANTWSWRQYRSDIKKVVFENGVKTNTRARYMFANCPNLEEVNFADLDTSATTNMSYMFQNCTSLTSIDLSTLDTSAVTNMSYMFQGCTNLTNPNLSNLNTANVTNMTSLFHNCSSLTSLNLNHLNTAKVTNMTNLFNGCSALQTLDIKDWNTANVTNMTALFNACSSLTNLDVSLWNTAKVTNLTSTFNGCFSLSSLDVSNWNTARVTSLNATFMRCSGLSSIDVLNWNTANVTNFNSVFSGCSGFTSINLSTWNTAKATNMGYFFNGCSGLSSIDLSNFNTSNVTDMRGFFLNCSGLSTIDLSPLDTAKVTNLSQFLSGCSGFSSIDLSPLNTSNVTNMSYFLSGCSGLAAIDLSPLDTSKVTNMSNFLSGCRGLITVDLSTLDTANVTNMSNFLASCYGLTSVDFTGFDTSSVTDMTYMFYYCIQLSSVDLSSFDTSNVRKMASMFAYCRRLKELDLSNFTTTGMEGGTLLSDYTKYMFEECNDLERLDISGMDLERISTHSYNIANMFKGTSKLKYLALGEKGKLTSGASLSTSIWYRYATLAKMRVADDTAYDLYTITSVIPAWYTTDLSSIDPSLYIEEHISEEGDHATIPWNKISDDTWTYTFNVFDDTDRFYVYEEGMDGYSSFVLEGTEGTVTIDGKTYTYSIVNGTDGTNQKTATFRNVDEDNIGYFTLQKNLAGSYGLDDENLSFRFTITLTGMTGTEILEDMNTGNSYLFTDGVGTVYLKHGESLRFSLPAGTSYTVVEASVAGFSQSSVNATGSIVAGNQSNTIFTNTKDAITPSQYGGFRLAKSLLGNDVNSNDTFVFYIHMTGLEISTSYRFQYHTYTGTDPAGNPVYSESTGPNFTSSATGTVQTEISLKDKDYISIDKLPLGASYHITEAASDYTASYQISDQNSISLTNENIEQGSMANTGRNTALSTATEKVDAGEDILVHFVNRRDNLSKEFSFYKYASDTGDALEGARFSLVGSTYNGESISLNAESDSAGFVYFGLLPVGSYTLTELLAPAGYAKLENYTVNISQGTGGELTLSFLDDKGQEVPQNAVQAYQVYDEPIYSSLKITKRVSGGSVTEGFRFRLTLKDSSDIPITVAIATTELDGNGNVYTSMRAYITDANSNIREERVSLASATNDHRFQIDNYGTIRFQLGKDETVEFVGIPYDTSYEVVEEPMTEYTSSISSGQALGSLTTETGESVVFLNRYDPIRVFLPDSGSRGMIGLMLFSLLGLLLSILFFQYKKRID